MSELLPCFRKIAKFYHKGCENTFYMSAIRGLHYKFRNYFYFLQKGVRFNF